MKLSKSQFERLLDENRLVLSLMGMSNIGKTYWSKMLKNVGFKHFSCDDLIEEKLAPALTKLGYSGIQDVSKWMGQPYDERFAVNQNEYLSFEKEVMEEIFAQMKNGINENTVIDTTGSVVHIGGDITGKLRQYSMLIYIEASENMKEKMFQKYLEEPKPVVFSDVYSRKKDETAVQALGRCYRELLDLRSALYTENADIIISREAIGRDITTDEFISLIKNSL